LILVSLLFLILIFVVSMVELKMKCYA